MEILTLTLGIAIGGALTYAHDRSVRRAVEETRKRSDAMLAREIRRNRELTEENNRLTMLQECASAHRYGMERGRVVPMDDGMDRLARTFGGRTVKFGATEREA